jgi:hypothetical protein
MPARVSEDLGNAGFAALQDVSPAGRSDLKQTPQVLLTRLAR